MILIFKTKVLIEQKVMASQQKLHSFKMTARKLPGSNSHKMSIMFMYVKYMASQNQVLLNTLYIVFLLQGFKN